MGIFIKICAKKFFDPFYRTFLTNQGKNKNDENKDKKYGNMSPIFEFSISKLSYVTIFMKS